MLSHSKQRLSDEVIYGDKRARTADLYTASVALSQLSYTPEKEMISFISRQKLL